MLDAKAPQAECEVVVNEIKVVYCSWQPTVLYCFSFYDARENVGEGGGGLMKNEGTFTYGVVSGRSGSGLYGNWW